MDERGHDVILVRHGELGLKSPRVRARLERTLTRRIEEALARDRVESLVRRIHSRHLVEAADAAAAMRSLARVFGVTTFSPATRAPAAMAALKAATAAYARRHWPTDATSFAIRARRTGSHPFTSREVAVATGAAVFEAMRAAGVDVRVDLDEPDFALHVEVRNKEAFLHHDRHAGPGGLPLGTQGRVALWLCGMDAAAAAYLMMRRGAAVVPYTIVPEGAAPDDAEDPAARLAALLSRWGAPRRVERIARAGAPPDPGRAMLDDDGVPFARAAIAAGTAIARRRGAHAVVTPETSRVPWAHRLPETHAGGEIPVLRPLMGLDRALIDDFRELLGLPRAGGGRESEAARAYTAGGRGLRAAYAETGLGEDARAAPEGPAGAEDAWDPW